MVRPETDFEYELLEAVKKGKIKTVQKLLNQDDINYLKSPRYFDYYLIIRALHEDEIAITKLLIEKGFRVYKKSKCMHTILHYAVESKDIDLIRSLLARRASLDILTPNEQKKTPFHLVIDRDQSSVIELFLAQIDVKTFDVKYFLEYAIQENTIPAVSRLIGNGFSLTSKANRNKNLKILDILLSYCSVKNMTTNDYDGTASVYNASIGGNLTIIKKYAGSGFPINISLKLSPNSWSCLYNYSGFTLLHFAVKHVKLEVVQFLLDMGADIFAQNENGLTPLHLAFENKELGIWEIWKKFDDNNSIIDLILKINAKYNSNPINNQNLSHFHIACSRDEPAIVEHFLKLGAFINQPVKPQCHVYKGFSPLHFAAKFRCKKTVELLLKNGADVQQRDYKEMTALHIAAKESCPEVVSLLLQHGAGVNVASADSCVKTPLHWAFENNHYKIMDLLLSESHIADSNPVDSKGISHFHIACTRNNVNVVKKFIERGVSVDACVPEYSNNKLFHRQFADWSGYSPLHFAVCYNKAKIVQLLLDSGANIAMRNFKGYTAHHISCQYIFETFAEFLEKILHDLNKEGQTTPLLHSLADVTKVDEKCINYSRSAGVIDWSANRSEHLEIINSLFRNDVDVNCTDYNGNTSLFWVYWVIDIAVHDIKGKLQSLGCSKALSVQLAESLSEELHERRKLIINHFLKLDANLDNCSQHGSILHCVAISSRDKDCSELMELFIKSGADVKIRKKKTWTPLHDAALHDNTTAVRVLLNYNAEMDCASSYADSKGNSTPLLFASHWPSNSQLDIIKLLADHGANVNAKRLDGKTALHDLVSLCMDKSVARFTHDCKVFKFEEIVPAITALIEAGANLNIRDSSGYTPLHIACRNYNYHFASMLLDSGADINVEDKFRNSVCCYVYTVHSSSKASYQLEDFVTQVVNVLRMHVVKMKEIGMPISERTLSSVADCARMVFFSRKRLTDQQEKELTEKCRAEVQVLKDTKIHDKCTLYDAMFKNENTLSHLVNNPAFEAVLKSESFEKKYSNYGYLVKLKYQEGVKRGELLPSANFVLSRLAGMKLPDACSENIYKHFRNFELKESTETLRGILDLIRR